MIKTATVTFYTYYASALINDDYSGIEDSEEQYVKDFLRRIKRTFGPSARVIDCIEDTKTDFGFSDYRDTFPLAGEVISYTIAYKED